MVTGYRGSAMANLTIHSVDYRFSKQIRALRKGTISCDHGATTLDCSILDISEAGARLRTHDAAHVPVKFRLRLLPTLTIGCEVVDRDHGGIGVAFVAS